MNDDKMKRLFEAAAPGPTDEQKERMYRNLLTHSRSEDTKLGRKGVSARRSRFAVMAALLTVLLTTTALAAAYRGLDETFLKFLGPATPEQAAYLSNGAYTIDKQVANEEGTLILKQAIGDGNLAYILMDFIAPEGTALNAARYRFENPNTTTNESFHGTGFKLLDDGNPNDNKISMVMSVMTENSLEGQTARFRFTNLQEADPFPGIFKTVIAGAWEAEFKLDFKAYSSLYQPNRKIDLYGYEAVLKSVSVSPISIALKIESDFAKEIGEAARERRESAQDEETDEYPITIRYADGTSETTGVFSGLHLSDLLSRQILTIKTFDKVINDKEISSIVFFGAEVPIDNRTSAAE